MPIYREIRMLNRSATLPALLCASALLMLPATPTQATTSLNAHTTLRAQPSVAPIVIDGVLDDAWLQSARFDNFAEFIPDHLVAAGVATEGYITHDDTDLYIAFLSRPSD